MSRTRAERLLLVGAICIGAVAVRLIAINQPFTDPWSWRQSDVAAIARNYCQTGYHFAHPQIDWSGSAAGYVGSEFPILPFLAAVCYKFAGVHEWIGRSGSLVFFAVSLPFFFALVSDIFGEVTAVWALAFYGFAPVSIMASRCFMPDMPSLSLCIVGLYCFVRWLDTEKWFLFFSAAIAIAFAILIKLPSAVIGAPIAGVAIERLGRSAFRRPALWLFGAVVLAPSLLWYCHARNIAAQFYPHHFFGAGGVRLMAAGWYFDVCGRFITSGLTIVPFGLALAGLFLARRTRGSSIFYWWLGGMVIFVIVVGYGNRHPWYQLPLIPVTAAFAGCAMAQVQFQLQRFRWLKISALLLIIGVFAAQSYSATRDLYRPAAADLRKLGLALKERTPPGSLIVVADYGDPTALYYGERKGWHFTENKAIYNGHPITSAAAIADLEQLRQQGATHIAFYSGTVWWLDYYAEFTQHLVRTSTLIEAGPAYQIFELKR